ncbi:MAG TPA: beta-ketoacyl-ACP synthase III [Candidatus Hydrogenedentes bacterium]|jgi:3-oxoacyl-[acyl-carrier-protein] synthase-3|nr:beta-ketoacyl-ACP synthase III [Candidatus Hydrogenedentota bacterium]HPJ99900.1 beta-ketoacyl-ACP synthase III [Candidatus Hydrogenedentota bacterium]
MLRARITGTGAFLPETVWTNAKLESMMDTSDEWIRKRTGIGQRHLAAAGEGSSDLGAPAARDALVNAGVAPEDVELIICCTTTPDYLFPATACLIQDRIGARNAGAFDLNAACTGFVSGLATANAYIRAGVYRTVLVVGTEAQTNRLNWAKRETAVLFGDGAGATLLQAEDGDRGVLSTFLGADGSDGDMLIIPGGGSKAPLTKANMDGSGLDIEMKGAELFKRATVLFEEASMKALESARLRLDDVDLFVPHQANARIIGAAAKRLGLPEEKVVLNLERVANTTSASIPLALHEAVVKGRVKDGDLLLLAGFGAGLTWGAAVIRW